MAADARHDGHVGNLSVRHQVVREDVDVEGAVRLVHVILENLQLVRDAVLQAPEGGRRSGSVLGAVGSSVDVVVRPVAHVPHEAGVRAGPSQLQGEVDGPERLGGPVVRQRVHKNRLLELDHDVERVEEQRVAGVDLDPAPPGLGVAVLYHAVAGVNQRSPVVEIPGVGDVVACSQRRDDDQFTLQWELVTLRAVTSLKRVVVVQRLVQG